MGRRIRVGSAYGVDAGTMLAVIVARISGGRAIVAVGVGAVATDLPLTGEVIDLYGTGGAAPAAASGPCRASTCVASGMLSPPGSLHCRQIDGDGRCPAPAFLVLGLRWPLIVRTILSRSG